MRQAAVVDVEIRVDDRLALIADEAGLRLDPQARLLLLGVGDQPGFEIPDDLGIFGGDIGRLARVLGEIEELRFSRAAARA